MKLSYYVVLVLSTLLTFGVLILSYPAPSSDIEAIVALITMTIASPLPGLCLIAIMSIIESKKWHRLAREQDELWNQSDK